MDGCILLRYKIILSILFIFKDTYYAVVCIIDFNTVGVVAS